LSGWSNEVRKDSIRNIIGKWVLAISKPQYDKEYREKNIEKIRERRKKFREENKELVTQQQKEKYERWRDKKRELRKIKKEEWENSQEKKEQDKIKREKYLAYQNTAAITSTIDGTPGASDMPGSLIFYTTPDGSATLTERMRINNAGDIKMGPSGSPDGQLDVTRSLPAADMDVRMVNSSTASSANGVRLLLAANGTNNTGDAFIRYIIKNGGAGEINYSQGIDTSDSSFRINTGTTLGAASDGIKIASTGRISFPGGIMQVPTSGTLPATCTAGDVYVDTSRSVGNKFLYCDSPSTWVQLN